MISYTLQEVINDMKAREELGKVKYNCTLDRQDLTLRDWLQHAYEENLDAALYLKRAIIEIDKTTI
jgi:hypothetical protein